MPYQNKFQMLLKTSIQKNFKNFNFMVKSEIFAIEKIIKNFPNPKLGPEKFLIIFMIRVFHHMKKEFENGFCRRIEIWEVLRLWHFVNDNVMPAAVLNH